MSFKYLLLLLTDQGRVREFKPESFLPFFNKIQECLKEGIMEFIS